MRNIFRLFKNKNLQFRFVQQMYSKNIIKNKIANVISVGGWSLMIYVWVKDIYPILKNKD